MRSSIQSSVLVLCMALPTVAAAAEPPEGTPPTPVTLPEEPEASPAPSAPASKDFVPPKPAPGSTPPAAVAPPAGPAPAAGSAPPAPPPGPMFVPQPPPFAAPQARPTPPDADSSPYEPLGPLKSHINIALNLDTVWYTGTSFDFFSEQNNSTSPGVSLGYALWIAEPLSIVPELGWGTNTVSQGGMYGGAITRTELQSHDPYGGLSVRYGILKFLETHVRASGGASVIDALVEPSGSSGLEANGVAPFGTLGGGLSLHSPAGALETRSGSLRSVVAGVTIEGGYRLGGDLELTPTPIADAGRIPTTYMSLGKLERSGPYVRTSLVVRF